MESFSSLRDERQASSWPGWLHPMLLASLLLHGVFLVIPVASTAPVEEEVVEEEVEKPEQAIALSALRETRPAPKATPKAIPSPSFTPIQRPAPVNPAPVVAPSPSPSPSPSTPASPQASPSPEATVSTTPEAGVEAAPDEAVSEDVAIARNNLIASLNSGTGLLGQAPPYNYFRQPELYFTQGDNGDPNFTKDSNFWVPGIVGVDWYNDTRANEAIAQLQSTFTSQGATMEEIPAGYGGRQLFAVVQNGDPLLYLNVIPGRGNISTVVVQWDRDPNTPAPAQ